jgi:16S rRNA (guanine966-N2)-methyltransferase
MRIISGSSKGRRLKTPKGQFLRPTADRVKEALFNILPYSFEGMRVLDLFAGTGNLSIEALSRGAAKAILVDSNPKSVKAIRENLSRLDLADRTEVWPMPASRALSLLARRNETFDVIFLDPPYESRWLEPALRFIAERHLLDPNGVVVAEHSARRTVDENYGTLALQDRRRYGSTILSFYRVQTKNNPLT